MTLPIPQLDNRRWIDLVEEGRAQIVPNSPAWTDHNVHDPGITLIELLAYQTELELYRLNTITSTHRQAFLNLIGVHNRPNGPRPAATLLVYESTPPMPVPATTITPGEYFVPRQPPSGRATPKRGVGTDVVPGERRITVSRSDPWQWNSPRATTPTDTPPQVPEFGFRAAHALYLTGIRIAAIQSFDGREFRDITDVLARGMDAWVWGDRPLLRPNLSADEQPALYLGLDTKLCKRILADDLTLWVLATGHGGEALRTADNEAFGEPWGVTAPSPASEEVAMPREGFQSFDGDKRAPELHGMGVEWEYHTGRGWRSLTNMNGFRDDTCGFTLPGRVIIPKDVLTHALSSLTADKRPVGAIPSPHFYLRCRLAQGRPDAAPRIAGVFADAVLVEQRDATETPLSLNAANRRSPVHLRDLQLIDETEANIHDAANDLARRGWGHIAAGWGAWPALDGPLPSRQSVTRKSPTPDAPFVVLGIGSGEPNQKFRLRCREDRTRYSKSSLDARGREKNRIADTSESTAEVEPPIRIITDSLRVWTMEPPWGWNPRAADAQGDSWVKVEWDLSPDIRLCARTTRAYCFIAESSSIVFGDGEMGRVPPPGSVVVASYGWTVAEAANFAAGALWGRATELEPDERSLPARIPTIRFRNPIAAEGGRDAESLSDALNRLAAEFGADQELIAVAERQGVTTLDGLDLPRMPPPRAAVTLLDFESLARSAPGTRVARARAWAGLHPRLPGVDVPGSVTVIVVPELPADRPEPTPALIERVAAHLDARRLIACRVCVAGPAYAKVSVQATLHVAAGAKDKVARLATGQVTNFLHPLRGGPTGRGWPFGRGVHAGELLYALGQTAGVRSVTGLQIAGADGVWTNATVAIPRQSLVELDKLLLDVQEDA